MNWEAFKKRITNPVFLLALASAAYQLLVKYGQAPTFDQWQVYVDLVSYTLIGTGVYKTFDKKE